MKTVCVLGDGAWGTAVATLLAENGYHVRLWCYDPEVAATIRAQRINQKYLPGIILSDRIEPFTDLKQAICGVIWIFQAIPVKFLRSILEKAQSCYDQAQIWIILSKGIEQQSLMLPSHIIDDVFGCSVKKAVLSGPSFAKDLANKTITAVTIAASDYDVALQLQTMLANAYFRPYVSLDLIGAQVGGAIKNVIALGVGMLDGAGYTDNAKAFLLTRGLHEMVQLSNVLGGRQKTIYGLSGMGDLVLTSMGQLSKNVAVGKQLGQGKTLEQIASLMGGLPEGVNTVQSVHQLIMQKGLHLRISQGIYQIIFEDKKLAALLSDLMAHPLEVECDVNE